MPQAKRVFVFAAFLALIALLWLSFRPLPVQITAQVAVSPHKARQTAKTTDALNDALETTALVPAVKPLPTPYSTVLPESIIPLDYTSAETKDVRTELTPDELAAPMPFQVALRMRNFEALRTRIAKGEILSQAEMSEKYYPTVEKFQQVASWLNANGLSVQPADLTRLSVAAVGSTATVASTLQVEFVRVVGIDGKEYTSAISAPSIPTVFTPFVVGVNGLQPQLKAFIRTAQMPVIPPVTNTGLPSIGPQTIAQFYNAFGLTLNGTTLDGTGQTIAIVGDGNPAASDLTAFWAATGIAQSYANVTIINPWGNTSTANNAEQTMDVEWASGMAPGAKIRLYESSDESQFVPAILSDLASNPGLHQASFSASSPDFGKSSLIESDSQYYAALAAAGITFFASSGDWGQYSPPGLNTSSSAFVSVSYPASDPCVTAVGGTALQFASATTSTQVSPDLPTAELGWQPSGGGTSFNFPRPTWQTGLTGPGVPSGAWRMVPDVAAVASAFTAGNNSVSRTLYLYDAGTAQPAGGTSVSSPIWAGLCALINQARGYAGLQPVGLLGPRIYPLIGTNAFNDITVTNNNSTLFNPYLGGTAATTGYDICTGIGSPNVKNLITALAASANPAPALPQIVSQSGDQSVSSGGTATLSVTVTTPSDSPILSYQWRVTDPNVSWYAGIDNGNSTWLVLSDGQGVSGSATRILTLGNVSTSTTLDKSGNARRYDCVVENQYGFAYSTAAAITIQAAPPPPPPTTTPAPANQSSAGGGGGAPSLWFLGALSLLAAFRQLIQGRHGTRSCSSKA